MTREQMITNLVKAFNGQKGTRYRFTAEPTYNIVNEAIEVAGEEAFFNREILKYAMNHESGDLHTVFQDFINSKRMEVPTAPVVIETPQPTTPQNEVNNYMGLLEKTLSEVIVKTQGENIVSQILGSIGDKVDDYVRENYGTIKRKVELKVDDVEVEFDEKLHEKFETVLKFVKMDEPVFLTGQAGTGKNVICKQVAKALGLDFYFTNTVTQEYKLTGFTDATGTFHETQFYKAFKMVDSLCWTKWMLQSPKYS